MTKNALLLAFAIGVLGVAVYVAVEWLLPPQGGSDASISIDFAPNGGGTYDIDCTDQKPVFADARLYTPQISLSGPLVSGVSLFFEVKADRFLRKDPTLAFFSMFVPGGSTSPTTIITPANAGARVTPPGTPAPETQGFWLACTARCRVRGNVGSDNDDHANAYLELLSIGTSSATINIAGEHQSPRRAVRCR